MYIFLRRFISIKQIYKKNHTYYIKKILYRKRQKRKTKKETRNIERRKKKNCICYAVQNSNIYNLLGYIIVMHYIIYFPCVDFFVSFFF